jgi:hypothetical protein
MLAPTQLLACDEKRGVPSCGFNLGAHPTEWVSKTAHRALKQLRIASESGCEWLASQDACQQAHGRTRTTTVQRCGSRPQSVSAATMDSHGGGSWGLDLNAQCSQASEGRHAIAAGQEATDLACPFCERADQQRPMRDRLVAGHSYASIQGPA